MSPWPCSTIVRYGRRGRGDRSVSSRSHRSGFRPHSILTARCPSTRPRHPAGRRPGRDVRRDGDAAGPGRGGRRDRPPRRAGRCGRAPPRPRSSPDATTSASDRATRRPTPSCWPSATRRGRPRWLAARRDDARRHARAVPDVCRRARRRPRRSTRLGRQRSPGRGVRLRLQPLCRPEAQPRAAGDRRGAGRRVLGRPDRVLRRAADQAGEASTGSATTADERARPEPVISPTEACESGRIGRSRKPLYPLGTVGSNPTASAESSAAVR